MRLGLVQSRAANCLARSSWLVEPLGLLDGSGFEVFDGEAVSLGFLSAFSPSERARPWVLGLAEEDEEADEEAEGVPDGLPPLSSPLSLPLPLALPDGLGVELGCSGVFWPLVVVVTGRK